MYIIKNFQTFFAEIRRNMKSRESSFPTQLSEIDIAGGEFVDQLQMTVFGCNVDWGVANLDDKF